MKTRILVALAALVCLPSFVASQVPVPERRRPQAPMVVRPLTHPEGLSKVLPRSVYRTRDDWQKIIDSTWGMGLPLYQKQQVFDAYATRLSNEFDGFLSLGLNWDSLRTHYRSQIDSTTSRGRFSGIMTRFAMSLRDGHTFALDTIVTYTPLSPGTPLVILYGHATIEHFGAVLTALPDSTALVLRTVPNHPLGLQPGDIVLGYDGVLWKNLLPQLLNAGFPVFSRGVGAASAEIHHKIRSAGLNWHLFDTIDILKHATHDTVHLSVAPLLTLPSAPMLSNEQLDIPGIPFPDYFGGQRVTYGKVPGTNIGCIYVFSEWPTAAVDAAFYNAVRALWETDGLVIDMRYNEGGWALFDQAFTMMFSQPLRTIEDSYRAGPGTFDLVASGDWDWFDIPGAAGSIYDRPIAVLVGPACLSMGDLTVQRLRYHPMVRFFGKSSWASLGDNLSLDGYEGWGLHYSISDMFHTSQPGTYLNRREFPIDEPVWHNPDDVAEGTDPVVARALEWITGLCHGHDLAVLRPYVHAGTDTLVVTGSVTNAGAHVMALAATLVNASGDVVDSILMMNDGLHGDGLPGDSIWGAHALAPAAEGMYSVGMTTFDLTAGSSRHLPAAVLFTTAGPVVFVETTIGGGDTIPNWGDRLVVALKIRNAGTTAVVPNVRARVRSLDTSATSTTNLLGYGNIAAGQTVLGFNAMSISFSKWCTGERDLPFEIVFSSNNVEYWRDTFMVHVTDPLPSVEDTKPLTYALDQNYPNPFNPSTTIRYALPSRSHVTLIVFNTLGQKVATLVDEIVDAGRQSVEFDPSGLASGVYLYRLQAGDFVSTKKLVILK